jgi:protein-S-isoprenylcysteine O-methyltransferase Ste14
VLFNAGFFVVFGLSFLTPLRHREWRSFGVFGAFIVALFTEMYGFPLTIYVLTSVLGSRYPAVNPFSHANGHLWLVLLDGGPLLMAFIHLVSNGLMIFGLLLVAAGWTHIHQARGGLVTTGLYRWVRHPQYSGLFIISLGLLLQWPTLATLLTWPVLLVMYGRLARREEADAERQFDDAYRAYAATVPRFVPRLRLGPRPPARMSLPAGSFHEK